MIAIFPEIIALARAADVERLAVAARRYFEAGGRPSPRPDMTRLLKAAGLTLATLSSPSAKIGALVARDKKGAFEIGAVLAPETDELTARFVLAHMLGHYLLDILPLIAAGDYAAGGFREEQCPLKRYALSSPIGASYAAQERKERRADAFAAALLMPAGMLKKAVSKIVDKTALAAFFGVSLPCLERRLDDLGLSCGRPEPSSFLAAERQLSGDARAAAVADEQSFLEVAVAKGPADAAMPRGYAASSYHQTERNTRRMPPSAEKKAGPQSESATTRAGEYGAAALGAAASARRATAARTSEPGAASPPSATSQQRASGSRPLESGSARSGAATNQQQAPGSRLLESGSASSGSASSQPRKSASRPPESGGATAGAMTSQRRVSVAQANESGTGAPPATTSQRHAPASRPNDFDTPSLKTPQSQPRAPMARPSELTASSALRASPAASAPRTRTTAEAAHHAEAIDLLRQASQPQAGDAKPVPAAPSHAASTSPSASPETVPDHGEGFAATKTGGLERLRAIARTLDKSVPK